MNDSFVPPALPLAFFQILLQSFDLKSALTVCVIVTHSLEHDDHKQPHSYFLKLQFLCFCSTLESTLLEGFQEPPKFSQIIQFRILFSFSVWLFGGLTESPFLHRQTVNGSGSMMED
jgi:hypothetical protein